MEFFMSMIPPTVTAQEQKTGIRNGKPYRYDPQELLEARSKLLAFLNKKKPDTPYTNGVRLTVKWLFPIPAGSKHYDGEYRITKPDTDNLNKMLKDCMTKCGFWKDDALVCSEIIEKFWALRPGIYIRIEQIDEEEDCETKR